MTNCCGLWCSRRCWIVTAAALVYFVLFPADLNAVLAPLRTALSLSSAISPWLYGLAAVALVCWTAHKIWLAREPVSPKQQTI